MRYYYDPLYGGYLRELKNLATQGGGISRELELLRDIRSGVELSPDRKALFENPAYYGGKISVLEKSVNQKRHDMRPTWMRFLEAADALGIERGHDANAPDYPLYQRFFRYLCVPESYCDLRAMIHRWINADTRKMKAGLPTIVPNPDLATSKEWKKLEALSVPVIMSRYDALLKKRGK